MGSSDDEFKHESLQDTNSIIKYLEALSAGFEGGKIILGSKDKTLMLHPHGLLKMVVKAKKKSDRVRLILKFTWKDGVIDTKGNSKEPLTIDTIDED